MYHQLKFTFFCLLSILIISCNQNKQAKSETTSAKALAIANANGVDEFEKVRSLEFTFNVEKDSAHVAERHWKWMPVEDKVIFYDKTDSTVFKRSDTSTAILKKLNGQFTNDEYWLIFPYHLKWDAGYTFTEKDTATGPVTEKKYHLSTIKYTGKAGFTPGDMYELYTDQNNVIQEWAFHKGGSKEPSLMTSWENYSNYKGLKIAKDHKSKDGKFRIYFTGIAVQ